MKLERRYFAVEELRAEDGEGVGTITGYAAVFDSPSLDLGGFREVVKPGAFATSVQDGDVRALFNHDPNFVLGRTRSRTLALEEDAHGLRIRVRPPEATWARDLVGSIKRGDISQMSFGFYTKADRWETVGEARTRFLLDVELVDVSPVTFPAYPATKVQARAQEEELAEFRAMGMAALPDPAPDLADLELRQRRTRLAELG